MYSPNYTFRDGVEPSAYQVWPNVDESSEVIHEACAKDVWEREFPLYADDIELMRCLEPIICDRCDKRIAEAAEKCAHCHGRGEVEGYGGNLIYCGLCAGTGFKHNLDLLKVS
jgi:hypothetical protein